LQDWPKYDVTLSQGTGTTIPIQINGKRRGEITIKNEEVINKELVLKKSKQAVSKYLENTTIIKDIYIEGKIVNFVVKA